MLKTKHFTVIALAIGTLAGLLFLGLAHPLQTQAALPTEAKQNWIQVKLPDPPPPLPYDQIPSGSVAAPAGGN